MKRIVVPFERLSIVEVQGKLAVDPNRSKVAHRPIVFQTENLRKKTRRGFLVTRRHNSMIQCDRHDCLPRELWLQPTFVNVTRSLRFHPTSLLAMYTVTTSSACVVKTTTHLPS